jgi:hypothetical protein
MAFYCGIDLGVQILPPVHHGDRVLENSTILVDNGRCR